MIKLYLRLLKYIKPYRRYIFATWFLSLAILVLDWINVWAGSEYIENIISGKTAYSGNATAGFIKSFLNNISSLLLDQSTPFRSLIIGAGLLFLIGIISGILKIIKLYIIGHVNQSVIMDIRREMFGHLTALDLGFSRKYRPGEISFLFTNDVDQVNYALIDTLDRLFMQPVKLVVTVYLMFILSPEMASGILLFLVISSIIIFKTGNYIRRLSKTHMERSSNLHGYLNEFLSSVILSKSMNREDYEKNKFKKINNSLREIVLKRMFADAFSPQLVNFMTLLMAFLLLVAGGYQILITRSMNGAILIKFAFLLPMAAGPMRTLATLHNSINISLVSTERIFSLLDEPVFEKGGGNYIKFDRIKKHVQLNNVSYKVGSTGILSGISFRIKKNSIVLISGESGSGKTTILSLIAGFIKPTSGEILVDGTPLSDIDIFSWRGKLGIVSQEPVLLNGTIRENLLYGKRNATDKELVAVMKKTMLWGKKSVFADGLDSTVGNRGEIISGGERQRLTIARSMLVNPQLLLMDEPTSMLDYENKLLIKKVIKNISRGRTCVIVSHDSVLSDIADMHIQISRKNGIRIT